MELWQLYHNKKHLQDLLSNSTIFAKLHKLPACIRKYLVIAQIVTISIRICGLHKDSKLIKKKAFINWNYTKNLL